MLSFELAFSHFFEALWNGVKQEHILCKFKIFIAVLNNIKDIKELKYSKIVLYTFFPIYLHSLVVISSALKN